MQSQRFSYRKIAFSEELLNLVKFSYANNNILNAFREQDLVLNQQTGVMESYGVFLDEKLIASYYLFPFEMRVRQSLLPAGGIGTVASSPLHRGKGAVRFLMQQSLKTMVEKGHRFSVLYPFSFPFYEKYGWGRFEEACEHVISPSEIRSFPEEGVYSVEEYRSVDDSIIDFYNQFVRNCYNGVIMTKAMWDRELRRHYPYLVDNRLIVFRQGGRIAGMFQLMMTNTTGQERVSAYYLAYQDPSALKQIFRLLSGLSLQIKEIHIMTPLDFPMGLFNNSRTVRSTRRANSMIRIHRLSDLNGMRIEMPNTEIAIRLSDPFLTENNGDFVLRITDSVLEVAAGGAPAVECSIDTLSSVISGYTSFREAMDYGRAKALRPVDTMTDFPKQITFFPFDF